MWMLPVPPTPSDLPALCLSASGAEPSWPALLSALPFYTEQSTLGGNPCQGHGSGPPRPTYAVALGLPLASGRPLA